MGSSGKYADVKSGDILNNKYKLIKKLGQGRFSSVWEAVDTLGQMCAVKIYRAGRFNRDYFDNEYFILHELQNAEDNKHVVKGYDFFVHLIYNIEEQRSSIHPCIVFGLFGENLHELLKQIDDGLPTDTVRNLIRQILDGLVFLHSNGVIHTDLKPENILCTKPLAQILSNSDIEVVISDLGTSTIPEQWFSKTIGSLEYCSPEALLYLKYHTSSDIWSLGCLCYELITGNYLFDVLGDDYSDSEDEADKTGGDDDHDSLVWEDSSSESYSSDDDGDGTINDTYRHFLLMEHLLGPMPKSLTKYGRDYFNSKGKLKGNPLITPITIKQRLINDNVDEQDATEIEQFILCCLKYRPEERSTAEDLLKHPFCA